VKSEFLNLGGWGVGSRGGTNTWCALLRKTRACSQSPTAAYIARGCSLGCRLELFWGVHASNAPRRSYIPLWTLASFFFHQLKNPFFTLGVVTATSTVPQLRVPTPGVFKKRCWVVSFAACNSLAPCVPLFTLCLCGPLTGHRNAEESPRFRSPPTVARFREPLRSLRAVSLCPRSQRTALLCLSQYDVINIPDNCENVQSSRALAAPTINPSASISSRPSPPFPPPSLHRFASPALPLHHGFDCRWAWLLFFSSCGISLTSWVVSQPTLAWAWTA